MCSANAYCQACQWIAAAWLSAAHLQVATTRFDQEVEEVGCNRLAAVNATLCANGKPAAGRVYKLMLSERRRDVFTETERKRERKRGQGWNRTGQCHWVMSRCVPAAPAWQSLPGTPHPRGRHKMREFPARDQLCTCQSSRQLPLGLTAAPVDVRRCCRCGGKNCHRLTALQQNRGCGSADMQ